jgi:hypothetical protein
MNRNHSRTPAVLGDNDTRWTTVASQYNKSRKGDMRLRLIVALATLMIASTLAIVAQTTAMTPSKEAKPAPEAQKGTASSTFTQRQQEQLLADIKADIKEAERWYFINSALDSSFKVALLIITIGTTVLSALGNREQLDKRTQKKYGAATTILAGLTVAFSAFAFTQFDYSGRQQIYRKKTDSLIALRDELRYSEPDNKTVFLLRLQDVRSWGDNTPRTAVPGATPNPTPNAPNTTH